MKRFEIEYKQYEIKKSINECDTTEQMENNDCILTKYFSLPIEKKSYEIFGGGVIDRFNKIETDRKSCFVFVLYDTNENLEYPYKYLGNVKSIINDYENYISEGKNKMFYRIYLDTTAFLTNIQNMGSDKRNYVFSIFEDLLKTGLVEIHQIQYPISLQSHMKRMIRFLPFLDTDIDYIYSKDIDGVFSINDINIIESIECDSILTDDEKMDNFEKSSYNFSVLEETPPIIERNSKYKLIFLQIYKDRCSPWLSVLYHNLINITKKGYYYYLCIPGGVYMTNLKLSQCDFNRYYSDSLKLIKDLEIKNEYLDEIFLNYLCFEEKKKINNLLVFPIDIEPGSEEKYLNHFNFDISLSPDKNKIIFEEKKEEKKISLGSLPKIPCKKSRPPPLTPLSMKQKYLKYKQKYLELKKNSINMN